MDNVTKKDLMDLVDSLGTEIMYLIQAGNYQRAEELKAEIDEIILTIQNV